MNATGTIEITEELTLINPSLDIVGYRYDIDTKEIHIDCLFMEGAFKHQRTFTYQTDGSGVMVEEDILPFINNDPVLSVFQ